MTKNRFLIAVLVATMTSTTVFASATVAGPSDLLPDLSMGSIFSLVLRTSPQDRKRLRFGTVVYNIGDGPIEVRGDQRSGNVMTRVQQWVHTSDGGGHGVNKSVRVFYSGDGHDHFHITRFINVRLEALPGTATPKKAHRLRKIGFCLVDSVRMGSADRPPNAAISPSYFGCSNAQSQSVKMGISVGWGDVYSAETKYQHIDVTNMPAGNYRLCATVNGNHAWSEKGSNFANNQAWIDIALDANNDDLDVLNMGRSACGVV